MIVPQTRMLWWVGLVVIPAGMLAIMIPEALPLCGGLVALIAAAALLDAALAINALDGIQVELPGVVRMSKDRPGEIELKVRNENPSKARNLRFGLPFPAELHSGVEDLRAQLPVAAEWSRLTWPCTALKRGIYRIRQCHLETTSAWGLWVMRAVTPVSSEIRVYPNLLTERKGMAALFLNRGAFGIHAMRQIGKGRDFEKLRDYLPGDSFEDIHWKATAKRGRPVTKMFQIERTQEVYVVIDASRLSAREVQLPDDAATDGAPAKTVSTLERYITASLVLGMAAEQQGDLFGLVVFGDKVERFVSAKNGKSHFGACRDAIYTLEPRLVSPDFDEVSAFIKVRMRKRALLVFLTALEDPVLAESFERNMELISRQHLVLVNTMLQPGTRPLFTNPDVAKVDDLYAELGGHIRWQEMRELGKRLQRRGVTFSTLENEKLSVQLVTQYLTVKRRQLL